jgi:hypothetical protein
LYASGKQEVLKRDIGKIRIFPDIQWFFYIIGWFLREFPLSCGRFDYFPNTKPNASWKIRIF